jgi:lipoprotein-anchoring transpeptidase ErfK/SrfK
MIDGRSAVAVLVPALLLATSIAGTASAHSRATLVRPTTKLVALLRPHEAYALPSHRARWLGHVAAFRPLTAERTTMPVLRHRTGARKSRWLQVRLPGRPNGRTAWIDQRWTALSTSPWHLFVRTGTRRVLVYRRGHVVRTFVAVVGKPSTPTPHGNFFVEEVLQLHSYDIGAPYALALSARSNVLQEFEGGPGQIALHGLGNVGGVLGTAVSHGCVRLGDTPLEWLVHHVGPGVPVTIVG